MAHRDLSASERTRYSRHLTLPEVGVEGQLRLKAAKVLLIGAGGLGSPIGTYLAAAGVGTIGLVDFDVVELSNLQRQVLHTTPDVGRSKLESATDCLHAINPEITIETHETRIHADNALELIRPYDIVIDGTDNFPTRYLVNDACVILGKPNIYGSIFRFEGHASVLAPPAGPCYRCLFPEPPPASMAPSCAEGGVLGVLPGVIGCLQATEALKLLLQRGKPLIGRLLLYDALDMRFREVAVHRDPDCPVCGDHPSITRLADYDAFCAASAGVHAPGSERNESSVEELKRRMDLCENVGILDVRSSEEWSICHIAGAVLIPLGELPARIQELDPAREWFVHCKSGGRSADAVDLLRRSGFSNVVNVRGGILEWARKIDTAMPKY